MVNVHVTEAIARAGLERLGGFDQPLQYGMRGHLTHAGRGAKAPAFCPARQHVDDQLHRQACAMQARAVRLQNVSVTRAPRHLAPRAPAGMAVGAEGAQPQPAALVTARMGATRPRGIDGTRASVRRRHRIGSPWRQCFGMMGIVFTRSAMRVLRKPSAGLRGGGPLALGLAPHWFAWLWV